MNQTQPVTGTAGQLAPIVLFAYKRPQELKLALEALQANYLAPQSELHVFVDGPKRESDRPKVEAVRALIDNLTGFRTIHRQYAKQNQGLAKSVITGVTAVMQQYGQAIVLEDDLLPSRNFLDYMNQALRHYRQQPTVFSITGYTFPFDKPAGYTADGYLYPRTGSWGWATWADRWLPIDWAVSDLNEFLGDQQRCDTFNYYGSDRLQMLKKWQTGKIDSWAIRWCYAQANVSGLTLYPTVSKINNVGFTTESTNTHGYNRYRTILDTGEQRTFSFPDELACTDYYLHNMRWKFSLPVRFGNRLITEALKARRWLTKT